MTVPFSVDDFLLVQQSGKKHIVKVDKAQEDKGKGMIQDKFPYEEDLLSFEGKEILANYGKRPHSSIYEAYFKSFKHPDIGEVHFFVKADKALKKEIESQLTKAYKRLDKAGLTKFFPLYVEIRPEKGKMLGHYKAAKSEGILDIIALRPSDLHTLEQTFFHESGRAVWKRCILQRKAKAAWIKDYNQFIQVQHLTSKSLKKLYHELANSNQNISEFKSGLEEEQQLVLKEVISYIKKYHRLSLVDLNLLLESGDVETVGEVWPSDTLALSKIRENNISNYSLKNVEEYFSEVLATYLMGQKIPAHTEKLLTKTIQSI